MKPLQDARVLVTRPDPAGTALCTYLQEQGGIALHFPTIAFAPPPDQAAFEQHVALLGEQDWVLFISPQAVYASIPAIRRAWPNLPPRVQFAAVGAGTAKALQEAGYVALYPAEDWRSEGLLDLPEFQQLNQQACMIVRGEGGRDLIEKALISRGADVRSLIAYQRIVPAMDVTACVLALKSKNIDVIISTSYESVRNLKHLLEDACWENLKTIPLIVVSERIKSLAKDLGFQTIWVARNAGNQAIATAIEQVLSS